MNKHPKRQHRNQRLLQHTMTELLTESKLSQMGHYPHHGQTSCLDHCVGVAFYSLQFSAWLGLRCDRKSLVRAALLHDYFLYDWHDKPLRELHGYHHPRLAMLNAKRDVGLNLREEDSIRKHMFPLTITPPRYRESVVICLVDKYCALREVFIKQPYQQLQSIVQQRQPQTSELV